MAEPKTKKAKTETKATEQNILDLQMSDEQRRVTLLLLNEGARLERQGIIKMLEPHKGQSVSVDSMIEALSKVGK